MLRWAKNCHNLFFFFSHNIFNPIKGKSKHFFRYLQNLPSILSDEKFCSFVKNEIIKSCISYLVKILLLLKSWCLFGLFGEVLTLCQKTNFRLFQTQRVCRQQFQIWWIWQKFLQTVKQEGQDGPGSLTWFFEIALANFFLSLSEKNLQEFLYVCTVQEASIH